MNRIRECSRKGRAAERLAFAALLVLSGLLPGRARAQGEEGAFRTITLGVAVAGQVDRTSFSDHWSPPLGVELFAEAPFYFGAVQLGATILPYSGRQPGLPDFQGRFFFLDWRAYVSVAGNLEAFGGFRVGVFQMAFDDDALNVAHRIEHELGAGLVAGLRRDLGRGWTIRLAAGLNRVFLDNPLRETSLAVALGRSFVTPDWLLEFLR